MKRQLLASIGLTTIAVLGLAACSTGTTSPASSSDGTPVTGGTLTVAVPGDPSILDPMVSGSLITIDVSRNFFEKLFALDAEYTPRPMLADSYEMSEDRLTYTIKLRPGITFQDGSDFESSDVVASLERWMNLSVNAKQLAPQVASIEATDELTVTVTLVSPRYSFIADLSSSGAIMIPSEIAEAAPELPLSEDQLIGTGPYSFVSYEVGQEIVVERFDDYVSREEEWGGEAGAKHAYLDEIVYKVVADDNAAVNGLTTDQWQHASPSNDQYAVLKANPSLKVVLQPAGYPNVVYFNFNEGSQFTDLAARQAMNMIMNREDINAAAGGNADLTSPSGSFAAQANAPMYSTAGAEVYENYDPEAATELFAEAGITADTPIRIATSQTYPQFYQWSVQMQQELTDIGLAAEIQTFDFASLIAYLGDNPSDWDISMTFLPGDISSPAAVNFLAPGGNSGFASDELAALQAEYAAATSAEEAHDVVDAIQQFTWDELPAVVISEAKPYFATSSKLSGYAGFMRVFWNSWLEN
jgi:peptide/nickel transport system substrate-binding protein